MKLAGIFFQLATKIRKLEPRLKVAKLFCQWLMGDRLKNLEQSISLLNSMLKILIGSGPGIITSIFSQDTLVLFGKTGLP